MEEQGNSGGLPRPPGKTRTAHYPAISYSYNAIGNITSRTIGSTVYNYSYDDPNHKHAVSMINVNSQNNSFTYDDNGNMTSGKDEIGDRRIVVDY